MWVAAGWRQTAVHQRDPDWRRHSGGGPSAAQRLSSGQQGGGGGRVRRCRYQFLFKWFLFVQNLLILQQTLTSLHSKSLPESVVPSSGTFHVKLPKRRGVDLGIIISGELCSAGQWTPGGSVAHLIIQGTPRTPSLNQCSVIRKIQPCKTTRVYPSLQLNNTGLNQYSFITLAALTGFGGK